MKPEPEPCSICGRRRSCGKKSSNPGGSRVSLARSRFSDRMNTTAGLTCSATATNASLRSAMGLAAGSGLLGGAVVCCAAEPLRSEEHTSELQSLAYLVCRLLLEKKKKEIREK